jgi:hypothetical protein
MAMSVVERVLFAVAGIVLVAAFATLSARDNHVEQTFAKLFAGDHETLQPLRRP